MLLHGAPASENPEDLYKKFLPKSLLELKDYLSLWGLSASGNERELDTRAFSACEHNVCIMLSDEELKSRLLVVSCFSTCLYHLRDAASE